MGNSGSSKKKLDISNTPAHEGRRKQAVQQPPLPIKLKEADEVKTEDKIDEDTEKANKANEEVQNVNKSAMSSENVEVKVVEDDKTQEIQSHAAAKVAAIQMPLDVYYFTPSAPCRAVLMTARVVGADLNLIACNIMEGEHLKEDYVKMNPQSTIPTLNDNGFILWESRPIMAYLVNQYAKDDSLYPKNPKERALVDHRLYFDMGTLYQSFLDYYIPALVHGAPLDPEKLAKLEKHLNIFNTLLEGKMFSAGDHLTIADITLTVTVSNFDACGLDLTPYPNVQAWYGRTKDALSPYGYDEINQVGADIIGATLKSKLG